MTMPPSVKSSMDVACRRAYVPLIKQLPDSFERIYDTINKRGGKLVLNFLQLSSSDVNASNSRKSCLKFIMMKNRGKIWIILI